MTYEEALARFGLNPDIRLRQMFELGKLAAQQAQHQCKFPMCHNEEYQQALAEQIKRELYTGETAQRKPLSDDEIEEAWKKVEASDFIDCVYPFARAIERAHGIKENT